MLCTFLKRRVRLPGWIGLVACLVVGNVEALNLAFQQHGVAANFLNARAVAAADFNGDGQTDVLGAAYAEHRVCWWRNNGGAGTNWSLFTVASNFTGARAVAAADMNHDGRQDVVAAAYSGNRISLFLNQDTGGTWFVQNLSTQFAGAADVAIGDINGDGFPDIAGASYSGGVKWWQNVGGDATNWLAFNVDGGTPQSFSISLADVDGDLRLDVIGALYGANDLVWWRNVNGDGSLWTTNLIEGGLVNPMAVAAADLDNDGRRDVAGVGIGDSRVLWWRNTTGAGLLWTTNPLGAAFAQGTGAACADLDGNSHTDVIACAMGSDEIRWWENQGGGVWSNRLIAAGLADPYDVCVADVNGDGDLDVLCASSTGNRIDWWENLKYRTITATWTGQGTVAPSGVVRVAYGGGTNFVFTPDAHYQIMNVLVDGVGLGATNAYACTNVTANRALNVVFTADPYDLVVWSDWSTALPPVGTNVMGWGTSLVCEVASPYLSTAGVRRVCTGWTGFGSVPATGTSNATALFTLTNYSGIAWSWRTEYYLAVTTGSNGSTDAGSSWHAPGSNVVITAQPNLGYIFAGWRGDVPADQTNQPTVTLTMDQPHSVTAAFTIATYTITATAGGNGNISPSGIVQVAHGSSYTFRIAPDPGYWITNVLVDGSSIGVPNEVTFANVIAPHTVRAEFGLALYDLMVSSAYGLPEPAVGIHPVIGNSNVLCVMNSATQTLGSLTQAVCRGWTGSGSISASGTALAAGPFTFTNDSTIAWLWKTQVWLSVAWEGAGTTDVSSSWQDWGGAITITARPDPGYRLASWTGDVPGGVISTNPLVLTNDRTRAIAAVFEVFAPTLTVASAYGAATPPAGTNLLLWGTNFACTLAGSPQSAGAETQYICKGWTGSGCVAPTGLGLSAGPFTFTNHSHITWNWNTQVWLEVGSQGAGTTDVASAWQDWGGIVTITARPSAGFYLWGWTNQSAGWAGTNNPLVVTNRYAQQFHAVFTPISPALLISSPYGTSAPPTGTNLFTWNTNLVCAMAGSPQADGARTQFVCWGWTGSGSVPGTGSNTVTPAFNLTNNSTLAWNWRTQVLLNIEWNGPGTTDVQTSWQPRGTSLLVRAQADFGQRFLNWTGDVPGGLSTSNPLALSLSAAKNITAHFVTSTPAIVVASAYGTSTPPVGTNLFSYGVQAACWVDGSPVAAGAGTQMLCLGWSGTGSIPTNGAGTNTGFFALTNDSAVVWHWRTQVWVNVEWNGFGTTDVLSAWYDRGTALVLRATAATGHRFLNWTGDVPAGISTNNPLSVAADRTRNITAHFTTSLPAVVVSSAFGAPQPPVGTNLFSYGTNLACRMDGSPIAVAPTTQLLCRGWSGTGSVPTNGSGTNTSIFVLTNDSSITWNWSTQVWLDVQCSGPGTTDVVSAWCNLGTSVYVRAIPQPGYRLTVWTGDVAGASATTNPLLLGMTRSRQVTAHFDVYTPRITVSSTLHGTVSPSGVVFLAYGGSTNFIFTPDVNYHVSTVRVDGIAVGITSNYSFSNVTNDHTLEVGFGVDGYFLTVRSAYGTPVPPAGTNFYAWDTTNLVCRINGSPQTNGTTRYWCDGWMAEGLIPSQGVSTQAGPFAITNDASFTWLWKTQYWLSVSQPTNGTVTPTNGWFDAGSNVVVKATPTPGYRFDYWSGTVPAGLTNRSLISLPMTQAHTLLAHFSTNLCRITAEAGSYTTGGIFVAGLYGTIAPTGISIVLPNSSLTFTNTANEHCHLAYLQIDGNYVAATNLYEFSNVIEDHTIRAVYDIDKVTLVSGSTLSEGRSDPPVGHSTFDWNALITCQVTNSPYTNINSRYACTGWTNGTGNIPAVGSNAYFGPFHLTTNSTLTWVWNDASFWLDLRIKGRGSLSETSRWVTAGSNFLVTAAAAQYFQFDEWQGDVDGCVTLPGGMIAIAMSKPRIIAARFAADETSAGTPYWWLADNGLTNQPFEVEEQLDQDGDLMITHDEYIANSSPIDAGSFFELSQAQVLSGPIMQWYGVTGRLYTVVGASNLPPTWLPEAGYIDQPGQGAPMSYSNTTPVISAWRFLGVRVRLAPETR